MNKYLKEAETRYPPQLTDLDMFRVGDEYRINEFEQAAYIAGCESMEGEAVAFAEWIRDSGYVQSLRNLAHWYKSPLRTDKITYYTTEELYNLFKSAKSL